MFKQKQPLNKINLSGISHQLSREEMKRVMAGSFGCGGVCDGGRCSSGDAWSCQCTSNTHCR